MIRRSSCTLLIVVLTLSALLIPTPLAAQTTPTWQPLTGPAGGTIIEIHIPPTAPDRVYALVAEIGPFRSDNRGQTWSPLLENLPYVPTAVRLYTTLLVSPSDPDLLYLGLGAPLTEIPKIYRSTDGGTTWEESAKGLPMALEVRDLAIDPQDQHTLYAATTGGLYRSTDDGRTWQILAHPDSYIDTIAVDPTDSDHLLAIVDGHLLTSSDGGSTWAPSEEGLPLQAGFSTNPGILFDPLSPGTVYLVNLIVQGIYHSLDNGNSWQPFNDGFGVMLPTITAYTLLPDGSFYAGTADGIYHLEGTQWTNITPQLEASFPNTFPNALAVHPTTGALFLGLPFGLYTSPDGITWSPPGTGLTAGRVEALIADDTGRAFMAIGRRLYRSDDRGASWTPLLPVETNPALSIVIDPHNTDHLYYSVNGLPLRHSLDGGQSWEPHPSADQLPRDTHEIRFHPTDPLRLYLAGPQNFGSHTTAQGVYRSTDGGQTWAHIGTTLRATELALSADGGTIYAASLYQLLRSTDDGNTWQQADNGIPTEGRFIYDLAAHPTDPNVAWIAMGGAGVYRTTDRGASWQPFSDGLPGTYVNDLAVRATDEGVILYAATPNGVFVCRSGSVWEPLGIGLPTYAQRAIHIVATQDGWVYIGTEHAGAWRLHDQAPPPPTTEDPCQHLPLGSGGIWLAPTGFAVQGIWLDWFNAHGGLDVLGYPRSPATPDPLNPTQCVQYFQRAILEWHPENAPPYRIQRRLLVDLMIPGTDPPVSPAHPNGADYWYFPQTGHAVSNYAPDGSYIGFKAFFDSHGREDTFGYPLEEPKRRVGSDGIERWTQRFQAALFEYHQEFDIPGYKPGTNLPWRNWIVELALLGDLYIEQNHLSFGLTCPQPPMLGFGKVWHDHAHVQQRLGCPQELEKGVTITEQPFQHGWMFRRDDTDTIYILLDIGTWSAYPDTWQPGEPEFDPTISVPPGVYQPRRGLGKLWRQLSNPPVYSGGGLYWAIAPDRSFRGSVQSFQHGTMLWSDRRIIYVLYENGTWESYTDRFAPR